MQLKSLFSKWTQVAGLLLMGGALAWIIKLCIIVATNGQVITTGAAALFMKIGLVMLLIGSTGVGSLLSRNRTTWLRAIAIIFSPLMVFGSLLLLGTLIVPLFQYINLWYAQQEAPIVIAILVCMPLGYLLVRSYKTASGSILRKS